MQGNRNHQIHIGKMRSRKESFRKLSRKEPAFRGVAVVLQVTGYVGIARVGIVVKQGAGPLIRLEALQRIRESLVVAVRHGVVVHGFEQGQRQIGHTLEAKEVFVQVQATAAYRAPARQSQGCKCG